MLPQLQDRGFPDGVRKETLKETFSLTLIEDMICSCCWIKGRGAGVVQPSLRRLEVIRWLRVEPVRLLSQRGGIRHSHAHRKPGM